MKYLFLLLAFASSLLAYPQTAAAEEPAEEASDPGAATYDVRLEQAGSQIKVLLGDQHFTTFDFGSYNKPILYPIFGPGQIGMTRNWPMKDGVEGEAHDHPHHKSMWIAHEISGVDFWGEKGGDVKTDCIETEFAGKPQGVFRATSFWRKKSDGKTLLTDQTAYRFGGDAKSRWIDCTITFRADHGDITFDDTKEGLFAIRTHPDLRLTSRPKDGVAEVYGKAINSEGVSGKEIWGKNARWVLYQGPIDGTPMSIAMYDHPENLRHPTTWHARDYGLVTANPFGLHHFLGKQEGAGAYPLKNGEELTLRYRVEFFSGLATREEVESRYKVFCTPVQRLTVDKE